MLFEDIIGYEGVERMMKAKRNADWSLKITQAKTIVRLDKEGSILPLCSPHRAQYWVDRQSAYWVDVETIQMIVMKEDMDRWKQEVIDEAGRVCYLCGKVISKTQKATSDHVVPKKKRGQNRKSNLRCCCERCNKSKGSEDLAEYISLIKNDRPKYYWIKDKRMLYLETTLINEFYVDKMSD